MTEWVVDLFVEFRRLTNGRTLPCGRGLLGACQAFQLPFTADGEKASMRELAIRGGPFTPDERATLLTYCQHDVEATAALFAKMQPQIDLPRALVRGRFMAAAAHMERVGIPIDVPLFTAIREHWDVVKDELIARVDADFDVFDGRTFSQERFERYLVRQNIPWERTPTGRLNLDEMTFKERAQMFPQLHPLRELMNSLAKLRLINLAVGRDGRNRCLLSAFGAKTSRNAPSNAKLIFGPSVWVRHLIRPEGGRALALIDWSQEFGIAAALSGDSQMLAAYTSGDPYLAFAKQAGAVPPDGTAEAYRTLRDRFKAVVLGVLYSIGAQSWRAGSARRLLTLPISCSSIARPTRSSGAGRRTWSPMPC